MSIKSRLSAAPQEADISKYLTEPELKKLLESFPDGIIALDLETTGLSPLVDKVIELSAVKVTSKGCETFDQLINPEIPIPSFTTDIHGIKDEDVADQPTFKEVLPKFKNFIGELPLIAHNAKFDLGFLVFAFHQSQSSLPASEVYCSCQISRSAFKEFPNHKLATLVEKLKIPLENHHRALDDAFASLGIFSKALSSTDRLEHCLNHAKLFKTADFKKEQTSELPEHLGELPKFVKEQKEIEIFYKGGSIRNQFRPVKPLSLLPMPAGNVLYALCLISNQYKSFALNKIKDFRPKK